MSGKPQISFIVSAYDRPELLEICLLSLLQQKSIKFEILVAINSKGKFYDANAKICQRLEVKFFRTGDACKEGYGSSNLIAKQARGEFLCFPSDDGYYVPQFGFKLYRFAKRLHLQLVYCDCIYDDRYTGSYEVMRVQPIVGHIDKGGFLIDRKIFPGFPKVPKSDIPALCDGYLVEQLKSDGDISYGKIHDILWFHN